MAKSLRAKKRCCKDRPRCKRCAVTCRRLETMGYAERVDKLTWKLVVIPPKKVLRAARAR